MAVLLNFQRKNVRIQFRKFGKYVFYSHGLHILEFGLCLADNLEFIVLGEKLAVFC